jgi:hypothetical protein
LLGPNAYIVVIVQMIEDLGIAVPADVGYYSGWVDSTAFYAQLFTASIRNQHFANDI